jgi:hypothetical protein
MTTLLMGVALGLCLSACGPSEGSRIEYNVTFFLDSADQQVDELDFDVTYTGGGVFVGERGAVECTGLNGAAGAPGNDFDDDDEDEILSIHLEANSAQMEEDDNVVVCVFSASVQPTTGNFKVDGIAADDDDGDAVTVVIDIEIDDEEMVTTTTSMP